MKLLVADRSTETWQRHIPISEIVLHDRIRRDLGDIDTLANSIREVGLLHPVVVSSDGILIAGQRRIEACRRLGMSSIPATVIDIDDLLKAERDENEIRKDFTPSEAAQLGRLIEEREREKAKDRMRDGGDRGRRVQQLAGGQLPQASKRSDSMKTRDAVGKAVGMSGKTYERSLRVVEAAEREPEKYGDLVPMMDEGGSVLGAYRELEKRGGIQKRKAVAEEADQIPTASIRMPLGLKRSPRKPPGDVVRSAIYVLEGVASSLESLDPSEVPNDVIEDACRSFTSSTASIRRFVKTINQTRS